MKSNILFLTKSLSKEQSIKDSIGQEYEVHCVTAGDIMGEMYRRNPVGLIVDMDIFEENIFNMIQSILDIEYLPVIYVYSKAEKIADALKNDTLIPIEKVKDLLLPLIKQSSLFKNKYSNVMESYDAIDLLNGEVKSLLKKYSNDEYNTKSMYKTLMDLVFAENLFLTNKPKILWVISSKKEKYEGICFKLINNKYAEKVCVDIDKEEFFKFDVYAKNGFIKNYNLNEISDIGLCDRIFPEALYANTDFISNFAGFAIGSLILIGINYKNIVTNYDVSIIKALAINFDLLETIKHQINELEEAFEYTTDALARAAETNDDQTGKHIKRVNSFAKRIAEELEMSKEFIDKLYNSAQMHDVGKIYVGKDLLLKPGKLTEKEFEEIKKHTVYGAKIIGDSKYLEMSAEVAKYHHEKYDGTGYPEGKKGKKYPCLQELFSLQISTMH